MRTPALLLLTACTADLPAGWEDALPVADFAQAACDGNPYEDVPEAEVDATANGTGVDVAAEPMTFRCAQEVEGFWKADGTKASLLVQPVDLHPSAVAGCDCLYRIDAVLPVPDATTVEVWCRWDALNDPNDPVLFGTADVPR